MNYAAWITPALALALALLMGPEASANASENAIEAASGNDPERRAASAPLDRVLRVVVTANRGPAESDLKVPQMVASLDREDLDRTVNADINRAIQRAPSVGRAPASAAANYWNPGFTVRGLGAQRVLTLTDGVRQAGQGIGYGGGSLSLYDPIMLERIEVLRGPRSVVYGTDAIGGVINVQTRQPTRRDAFGLNGTFRAEFDEGFNYDRYSAGVDFGEGDYAVTAGVFTKNAGRPHVPGDQPTEGSFEQNGAWALFDYYLNDLWTFKLSGNTVRNRDVLIEDSTFALPQLNIPGPPPVVTVEAPLFFEFPQYDRSMLGFQLEKDDPGALLEYLMAGFYWQGIRREFHRESLFFSNPMAGPASPLETDVVSTDDAVDTFELQLLSRWAPRENHLITAGIDLGYDQSDLRSRSVRTVVSNPFPGFPFVGTSNVTASQRADAEQYRLGLYVQDQWTVGDWQYTGGIRIDHFDVNDAIAGFEADETGLSGALSALYMIDEESSIFASFASGFRVPDLGERFQDAVVNIGGPSRVIGEPNLDPERSWNFEIGAKHEGERFRYELALFHNQVENFINDARDLGTIAGVSTSQFQNAGDVRLYGAELAVEADLTQNWSVYANAARTYTDEDALISVRDWVFNYGLRYQQELGLSWLDSLSGSLDLRTVTSTEDTVRTIDYDGFTVADLQFVFDLTERDLGQTRVIAGLRNLGDVSFKEPFFNAEQPERSAFLSIEHRF